MRNPRSRCRKILPFWGWKVSAHRCVSDLMTPLPKEAYQISYDILHLLRLCLESILVGSESRPNTIVLAKNDSIDIPHRHWWFLKTGCDSAIHTDSLSDYGQNESARPGTHSHSHTCVHIHAPLDLSSGNQHIFVKCFSESTYIIRFYAYFMITECKIQTALDPLI